MAHTLFRVVDFKIVDNYTLEIFFNDDTKRIINFEPVLCGEVFAPLRNLGLFNQVELNLEARTLVWPNGADFDPETLHNWDDEAMAELGQYWATFASQPVG